MEVRAYAKINLFLDVLNKRTDGYHNIISVMHSINLYDTLKIYPGENGITLETNIPELETDDRNLIVKAAKLLTNEPLRIVLDKKIPMGAGLGGGSSNAAAMLQALNKLLRLDIAQPKLLELGATLGADVPFCIMGGTALAEGIGEKLTTLPPFLPYYIVLACPHIHVSTKEVFGKLNICTKKTEPADFLYNMTADNLYNVFTPITADMHPIIGHLIADIKENGAAGASMTGTGSTVFGLFENEKNAENACAFLRDKYPNVKVILCNNQFIRRSPWKDENPHCRI